jgi:hypothetical protein
MWGDVSVTFANEVGCMKSTLRKPAQVAVCSPQIPQKLICDGPWSLLFETGCVSSGMSLAPVLCGINLFDLLIYRNSVSDSGRIRPWGVLGL